MCAGTRRSEPRLTTGFPTSSRSRPFSAGNRPGSAKRAQDRLRDGPTLHQNTTITLFAGGGAGRSFAPRSQTQMKRALFLLPVVLLSGLTTAQTPQTVTIGAGYADQVWFSLVNGVQQTRPAAEWDLAFEITGFTAAILANTQKGGLMVYRSPFSVPEWNAIDTAGMAGWPVLQNADTSWSRGAFNQTNTADEFDLGWGVYNSITHVVTGDSVHVMHLANG